MDVALPRRPRLLRRGALIAVAVCLMALSAYALVKRGPALPRVERDTLLTASVQSGPLVVRVRGTGTLRPEAIRWLTAESSGRVEEVAIEAGMAVEPETLVVRLENLDLRLMTAQADREAQAAEAALLAHQRQSRQSQLDLAAELANLAASHEDARRRAAAYEQLKGGIIPALDQEALGDRVRELEQRHKLAEQRLQLIDEMAPRELDVLRRQIIELGRVRQVRRELVEQLSIRAAAHGILQDVLVELGQWVVPGTAVAKVIIDRKLQAELRIAAEQAGAVAVGQGAQIRVGFGDAPSSVLRGRVRRIHPAASEGNVTVEIALDGPLPESVRPDQNVDGSIEVERTGVTLHVSRPLGLSNSGLSNIFRIDSESEILRRISVRTGRISTDSVEVLSGLAAGDEIVISDMSRFAGADAIQLD